MKTTIDRAEQINHVNDQAGYAHTKRAFAKLVACARRELGFPFSLRATTESGRKVSWSIQTPTDARTFVASANRSLDWLVAS